MSSGPANDELPATRPKSAWWRQTWVLGIAIFAAVLLNNSSLIFHSHVYETDDYAANSLQVIKAKTFHETLGHYCRFGFHHPGPAFFYIFGWGEMLFSDATHLVPTPVNAQMIVLQGLSIFFFTAALAVIARRLRRGRFCFLAISLLLAACHFGTVGSFYEFIPGHPGLFCLWPPCMLLFPFLCFLVAAASVAAGEPKDLFLMTVAACFLVHGHVAMPLFVAPLTILAYVALIRHVRRAAVGEAKWPWQIAPRQHWLAAITIAVFLTPILVDLFTAQPNNLQRIVHHLQTGYGEHKGVLQSFLYFLHFGAYSAYPNTSSIPAFETFDGAGTYAFFAKHWRAYGLWILVVLSLIALWNYRASPRTQTRRFQHSLGLVILSATLLSILWGCLQEGPMFYYNGLSNFAIYYSGLLLFALVVAQWIGERTLERRLGIAGAAVLCLAVLAAIVYEAPRFRGVPPDQAEETQFAAAIEQALKLDPVEPKFLNFQWQAGGQTTRLALYLERRGCRWMVREKWPLLFGEDRIVMEDKPDRPAPTANSSFWRVVLHSNSPVPPSDSTGTVFALNRDYDLIVWPGKAATAPQ